MDFDELGGATVCMMQSDGTTTTWVQPVAPRRERAWHDVGAAVNIGDAGGTALKLRVHGCGEETFVVTFSGSRIRVEGCGDYHVDFNVQGTNLTIRVSGHGAGSCGLTGGRWSHPIDQASVKTLSLQQHWVDAPLIVGADSPCATPHVPRTRQHDFKLSDTTDLAQPEPAMSQCRCAVQ